MYEFSSKSQLRLFKRLSRISCLRYCKCTSFQANHNGSKQWYKQYKLFAILQMYEFSSKSQRRLVELLIHLCCLRYCKCTSFQANHNRYASRFKSLSVVCDTANVRVFKQITTMYCQSSLLGSCLRYCKCTSFQANHNSILFTSSSDKLFAILQMYEFSSKSQQNSDGNGRVQSCLRYCKCTSFQANHNSK